VAVIAVVHHGLAIAVELNLVVVALGLGVILIATDDAFADLAGHMQVLARFSPVKTISRATMDARWGLATLTDRRMFFVVCEDVRDILVISIPLILVREARLVPIEPAGPLADLMSLRMRKRDLREPDVKRTIISPFYHLIGGLGDIRLCSFPLENLDLEDLPTRQQSSA
jgi:hypothetical protein